MSYKSCLSIVCSFVSFSFPLLLESFVAADIVVVVAVFVVVVVVIDDVAVLLVVVVVFSTRRQYCFFSLKKTKSILFMWGF